MSTFVTADLHFNHTGILRHTTRPWADVGEMNLALIERWNTVVTDKDQVWVVGDFGFAPRHQEGHLALSAIFDGLRGHKHLVVGNHDEDNPKVLKLGWETITQMHRLRTEGMHFVLCHYPLETWRHPGEYVMLHGHSHGTLTHVLPRRFDVGVDVEQRYMPILVEEYWERAQHQEYEPVDHHGRRDDVLEDPAARIHASLHAVTDSLTNASTNLNDVWTEIRTWEGQP